MAKVLIIEDNVDLLDFFDFFLKRKGFETQTISSKDEINDGLNDFKPDLILLDIWLGADDGREICKEIKKNNQSLPIILMSANAKLLENYTNWSADDIIEKPFDI